MPTLRTALGATINYQVRGNGFPVLLLAPGGMRSNIHFWDHSPYNPWRSLSGEEFKVIAMDQRNAGESTGPLPRGWEDMRDDQLAVLDDCGVDKCLLVGSCIGPSFQLALMKHAPDRFPAAVMMQPIGLAPHTTEPGNKWEGLNHDATQHWYGDWMAEMMRKGRFDKHELASLYKSLFEESVGHDFVFTVTRDDVKNLAAQHLLVTMGKDMFHPSETAREIARLAPHAEFMERWRDADHSPEVDARIESFLREHAARASTRGM